jgi:hypothetical protein
MILDMIAILYALDENALIIIYALIITYALILLRFKTLRIQDQNVFFFFSFVAYFVSTFVIR